MLLCPFITQMSPIRMFSISKNIAPKATLGFSYHRLDKDIRYHGLMIFGFPPPDLERDPEFIKSKASGSIYELFLHFDLLPVDRFILGGGVGGIAFTGLRSFGAPSALETSTASPATNISRRMALMTS